jgi:hypothetical protein
MRFKEFLVEREISDLDSVVDQIRGNCKPFLKAARGRMLFRGIPALNMKQDDLNELNTDTALYTPHPEDRPPKDSGRNFNFMFNAGTEISYGIKNIRRKSVFATSNTELAARFGHEYFFFPAGDFKYMSSQEVKDSYEYSTNFWHQIGAYVGLKSGEAASLFQNLAIRYKDDPHEWINDTDGGEQVVQELLADITSENIPKLYEPLKTIVATIIGGEYDLNENFLKFVRKGTEMLFYETHGYYSIPSKMVMKRMSDLGYDHIGKAEDERIAEFMANLIAGKIE